MKTWLVVLALGLLACLLFVGLRRDGSMSEPAVGTPGGPTFEVRVVKPRSARPLFGILPSGLFGESSELGFDHASPGALIDQVTPDRIDLGADDWGFSIVTDPEGMIAPETYLLFTLELANKNQTLRCRPAASRQGPVDFVREKLGLESESSGEIEEPSYGFLKAEAAADALRGEFEIRLAVCDNAVTGKTINWPPAPLTVVGWFEGLPIGAP